MRAVLIRSFGVLAAGGIVLAGVLYLASTVDARPPAVLDVRLTQPLPDDPETGLRTTTIEISFSEPVEAASAQDAIRLDPPAEGTVTGAGSALIFTPAEPLEIETEYTLTIGPGIRDLAGNEMVEVPDPFVFAISGRPGLAASDPADGADEVPVDAPIVLDFSALMDTASVEEALAVDPAVDHELRWSGERLEIVPVEPLAPGTEYRISIAESATDVSGVALAAPLRITFRTVDAGLRVAGLVPADGAGGISAHTQIAVRFDGVVDPESLGGDAIAVTPEVPGTLDVIRRPDDPARSSLIVFTPSAPLPANTTFEVTLHAGIEATDGEQLAEPVSWSFTTGAPQRTLSNQVLFISDRSGVANVWAMNPDGTGQRQVSAELNPVIAYATAPNGSSLVVGDGRRLVLIRADGTQRRVLTDPAHLEFDPTYAPDGSTVAFARADAETGEGLGLWAWDVEGGGAEPIELPRSDDEAGAGGGSDQDGERPLRAPAYSPDGEWLAFVDLRGRVGMLALQDDELVEVEMSAAGRPVWMDAGRLLVPGGDAARGTTITAPVEPLGADDSLDVALVRLEGDEADVEPGVLTAVRRLAVDAAGRLAWIDRAGRAVLAERLGSPGSMPPGLGTARVTDLAFGPVEDVLLVVVDDVSGDGGRIERLELSGGQRRTLVSDGRDVRWQP